MTFPRVNPPGWGNGEVLTSTQMNNLDTNMTKAVDGAGGGTYTLSAPLALNGASVSVGQDLAVGDDLTVADDATVGGDLTVTGNTLSESYTGTSIAVDTVRALKHLRLSAGTGPAGTANLTVGGTNQMLYADSLPSSTIYTILDTGAADGNFFLIFNRSSGFTLTINAPIGTIATITFGNCAICWRSNSIWRGQVLSAT